MSITGVDRCETCYIWISENNKTGATCQGISHIAVCLYQWEQTTQDHTDFVKVIIVEYFDVFFFFHTDKRCWT